MNHYVHLLLFLRPDVILAFRYVRDKTVSSTTDDALLRIEDQRCSLKGAFGSESMLDVTVHPLPEQVQPLPANFSKSLPRQLIDVLPDESALDIKIRCGDCEEVKSAEYKVHLRDKRSGDSKGYINFYLRGGDIDPETGGRRGGIRILYVESDFRGSGIGQYLMFVAAAIANADPQDVRILELEDMSAKAHKGSLYERLGCIYDNPPEPEMDCAVCALLNTWSEFKMYLCTHPTFFKQADHCGGKRKVGAHKHLLSTRGDERTVGAKRQRT